MVAKKLDSRFIYTVVVGVITIVVTVTLAWGNSQSDIRANQKDICYNREKIDRIYLQLDRIEKKIDSKPNA